MNDSAEHLRRIAVRATTLGEILDDGGLDQVDLLKMDIEGAEYDLIQDVDSFRRVRSAVIEVHGTLEKRDQFYEQLGDMNFNRIHRAERSEGPCETLFALRQ